MSVRSKVAYYLVGSIIYDIIGPHLLYAPEFVTKLEANVKGSYYGYAKRAHEMGEQREKGGKGEKVANMLCTNMYLYM